MSSKKSRFIDNFLEARIKVLATWGKKGQYHGKQRNYLNYASFTCGSEQKVLKKKFEKLNNVPPHICTSFMQIFTAERRYRGQILRHFSLNEEALYFVLLFRSAYTVYVCS